MATPTQQRRWFRSLLPKLVLAVTAPFLLLEGALRLQQILGPITDLALADVSRACLSATLNHVPEAREGYDAHGLKDYGDALPAEQPGEARVWFMGDSFMQGYGREGIPLEVTRRCRAQGRAVRPFNSAYGSYSPAIYVVQTRQLAAVVRPTHVVVQFDHTDLGDDWIRYRHLMDRDPDGRILAVRPTPVRMAYIDGLLAVRSHWLYSVRLPHKLWLNHVWMPAAVAAYRQAHDPRDVLDLVRDTSPNVAERLGREIAFFQNNLREFAQELERHVPPERILWVCHPHLGHLTNPPTLNHVVFDALAVVAAERGITYRNLTADFRQALGGRPSDYFVPGDEYSHYTPAGLKVYGEIVHRYFQLLLDAPTPNDQSGP